jgi:hypothetical protein
MLGILQASVPAWIRPWLGPTGELRLGDDAALVPRELVERANPLAPLYARCC